MLIAYMKFWSPPLWIIPFKYRMLDVLKPRYRTVLRSFHYWFTRICGIMKKKNSQKQCKQRMHTADKKSSLKPLCLQFQLIRRSFYKQVFICLQNGYTSVETTVSKSLPPPLICILKKHPPFFIDFESFTPPPTLNTGPLLGINNEQSLTSRHA